MDSGTCELGDDVNFGMCRRGDVWTQGRVELGDL